MDATLATPPRTETQAATPRRGLRIGLGTMLGLVAASAPMAALFVRIDDPEAALPLMLILVLTGLAIGAARRLRAWEVVAQIGLTAAFGLALVELYAVTEDIDLTNLYFLLGLFFRDGRRPPAGPQCRGGCHRRLVEGEPTDRSGGLERRAQLLGHPRIPLRRRTRPPELQRDKLRRPLGPDDPDARGEDRQGIAPDRRRDFPQADRPARRVRPARLRRAVSAPVVLDSRRSGASRPYEKRRQAKNWANGGI